MEEYLDNIYLQLESIIRAKLAGGTDLERPKCIVLSGLYNELLFRRIHNCIAQEYNDAICASPSNSNSTSNGVIKLIGVGDTKRILKLRDNLSDLTHSQFIPGDCTNFPDVMVRIKFSQGIEQRDILLLCSSDIFKCGAPEDSGVQDSPDSQKSDYLKVWGEKNTGHGLIVLHGCQNIAVDKKDRYCTAKAGSIAKSSYPTIEIDDLVLSAASYGLLMNPDFSRTYPVLFPELQASILLFEHQSYRIRLAEAADISSLVELEQECWAEGMRIEKETILERIEKIPEGNCVLELQGRVVAVIYSQRIESIDDIMSMSEETALGWHSDNGRMVQLIKLNVNPKNQLLELGSVLLSFMLLRSHMATDVDLLLAVTLCKNNINNKRVPINEYLTFKDSSTQLVDPILRFHSRHGAVVDGLVPNYFPDDKSNKGNGVLVTYDINNRLAILSNRCLTLNTHSTIDSKLCTRGDIQLILSDQIMTILPSDVREQFALKRPFIEMGLDSLDLAELKAVIEQYWGLSVESTFFFKYSTPEAVSDYIFNIYMPMHFTQVRL
ncbi:MAG: acyl carrier protein [Alteromonadaceae bacterium]|nr:acyl carrier protein [Alteromonadaceae bacterium]